MDLDACQVNSLRRVDSVPMLLLRPSDAVYEVYGCGIVVLVVRRLEAGCRARALRTEPLP
jgi:hypothetical protein